MDLVAPSFNGGMTGQAINVCKDCFDLVAELFEENSCSL
jgi:hypothetical protein